MSISDLIDKLSVDSHEEMPRMPISKQDWIFSFRYIQQYFDSFNGQLEKESFFDSMKASFINTFQLYRQTSGIPFSPACFCLNYDCHGRN